jgi:hypothetical protein
MPIRRVARRLTRLVEERSRGTCYARRYRVGEGPRGLGGRGPGEGEVLG